MAAAHRLFLTPGFARVSMDDLARELGMSKKTIYRHFPDKRSVLTAVLDRQFAAVGAALAAAAERVPGEPFEARVRRFLIAAGTELGRIGAPQLSTGRGGDAELRVHVQERMDTVIYRPLNELFEDGHRQGLLPAPPRAGRRDHPRRTRTLTRLAAAVRARLHRGRPAERDGRHGAARRDPAGAGRERRLSDKPEPQVRNGRRSPCPGRREGWHW